MIKNCNVITAVLLGVFLGLTVFGAAGDEPGAAVDANHRPASSAAHATPAAARPDIVYRRLPLYFEANQGQAPAAVRYLSRGPGYGLFLTSTGAVLSLSRVSPGVPDGARATAVVTMDLVNGNPHPRVAGRDQQAGTVNYFKGRGVGAWQRRIATYGRVRYASVYPGIDMVFHGRQDRLEYDFRVAPRANPGAIRLSFHGADRLWLDGTGRLHVAAAGGEIIQQAPMAYQRVNGVRRAVASRYVLTTAHQVSIALSGYDTDKTLVIDPVLSFSSYFGGSGDDRGMAIASSAGGGIYITGRTASMDFPVTGAAYDQVCGGRLDCSQTQISDTFIGGVIDSGVWTVTGSVTQNDSLTVTTAAAANARAGVTANQTLKGDFDVHVAMANLNEANKFTGMEVQIGASTYDWGVSSTATSQSFELQNSACSVSSSIAASASAFEDVSDISVERTGTTLTFYSRPNNTLLSFTLVGSCANVPTGDATISLFVRTADGTAKTSVFDDFDGQQSSAAPDVFVMRLDDAGKALNYATYLGGSAEDEGLAIAVDGAGDAYVTGRTYSADFPTTAGAFDTQCADTNGDTKCDNGGLAFLAVLSPDGATLSYGSYFGGCYDDAANGIALDGSGAVYLAGYTESAPDTATSSTSATCVNEFPLKNAMQDINAGRKDAFVAKLNPVGAGAADLVYSTFLGGSYADEALGIAVSAAGEAYVTGYTASGDFPLLNPYQGTLGATTSYDAFVTVLNATGDALVYSTLLGGNGYDYGKAVALDGAGDAYVTGWTRSTDFPVKNALQAANAGSYDLFLAELNPGAATPADSLVYATYLGGVETDVGAGIALDLDGGGNVVNVLLTGYSTSADFLVSLLRDVRPDLVTPLNTLNNLDNYVMNNLSTDDLAQALVQLDPSLDLTAMQALSRSDLIGRIFDTVHGLISDELHSIQYDRAGPSDAIIVKLDGTASSVAYATYLGGGDEDYGTGIALTAAGDPYVTGYTVTHAPNTVSGLSQAQNFPATSNAGAVPKTFGSAQQEEDAFVAKLEQGDADLAVTVTSNAPGPVTSGVNVTYTATVTNNGPKDAEGVVLTDVLQIGLNLVSATAAQGSCDPSSFDITSFNHTITCTLGALPAGAVTTVTVVATASPASPPAPPAAEIFLDDSASVTALATDGNTANNSASTSTKVNAAVINLASGSCDISNTKPTGCSVQQLGAFDPPTLLALSICLAWLRALRRRAASGYRL